MQNEMQVETIEQGDGSVQVKLDGNPLVCGVCGNQSYWENSYLLNTSGSEFLGVAWADDHARNFICTRCRHILWFAFKNVKRSRAPGLNEKSLVDKVFGRNHVPGEG
jgi:hypothetical protein